GEELEAGQLERVVADGVGDAHVDDGGHGRDDQQRPGEHLLAPGAAQAERPAHREPPQRERGLAPTAARSLVGPVATVVDRGPGGRVDDRHRAARWRKTSSRDRWRVESAKSRSPRSATASRTTSKASSPWRLVSTSTVRSSATTAGSPRSASA